MSFEYKVALFKLLKGKEKMEGQNDTPAQILIGTAQNRGLECNLESGVEY